MLCRPDYATARRLPWLPGTALVIGDLMDEEGLPIEVAPRQILRQQIRRAAERGYVVRSATELEFFLFRESYEGAQEKNWRDLSPHSSTIEDYQLLQTSRQEYILKRIRQEMCAADIPVEFSKGEAGKGQHEVNVTYAGVLETADRHLVFKNGIKEIAAQEGRAVTFMAKWTMDDAGSSCHIHNLLWDAATDVAVMSDPSHPTGLSTVGRQFLAGQLHAARQLAWCAAPTLNSYRRYVPGVGPLPLSSGVRTTAHAVSGSSATDQDGASNLGCPEPTSTRILSWPPASQPVSTASITSSSCRTRTHVTPTKPPTSHESLPP